MGFYEHEVRFYEQLAHRRPLHTPCCYFSALDMNIGVALLLLEDLAYAHSGNTLMDCSVAEAEMAVRAIASFHAAWWQDPQLSELDWLELRSLVSIQQAPTVVQQVWQPFFERMGVGVTDELLQVGEWLMQYIRQLSAYLFQEQPCTLIHNDYQADNLFFGEGRTLALTVADWQLATRGRGVLDLAGLLGCNLDPQARRAHEQRLLQAYHALLCTSGTSARSTDRWSTRTWNSGIDRLNY